MVKTIILISIIALIGFYSLRSLYRHFFKPGEYSGCSCGTCPISEKCSNKELEKKTEDEIKKV